MINDATWTYVRQHRHADVRTLALQGTNDPAVDLPMALQQIAGWQTSWRKLPSWAETEGLIFPPHINMEQCSSEQTARYKATLLRGGRRYVDLTGGFGVDFFWMSQGFAERVYVERNEALCTIAAHNFRLLGLPAKEVCGCSDVAGDACTVVCGSADVAGGACTVVCGSAADALSQFTHADAVYLDPARRNEYGGRTYGIADCTPNVLELLLLLNEKADTVVLKLSPMLDWRKAVADIHRSASVASLPPSAAHHVHEVHIVSVANECKELLLLLRKQATDSLRVVCVNDSSTFEWVQDHRAAYSPAANASTPFSNLAVDTQRTGDEQVSAVDMQRTGDELTTATYLYEPNASVMKAGCFDELQARYPVRQVAANSHLFVSTDEIGDFPGRRFQILAISSGNERKLKPFFSKNFTSLKSANIAVRNYPLSVDQLRKKLKLKDGGDTYIFATTDAARRHLLFVCRKN